MPLAFLLRIFRSPTSWIVLAALLLGGYNYLLRHQLQAKEDSLLNLAQSNQELQGSLEGCSSQLEEQQKIVLKYQGSIVALRKAAVEAERASTRSSLFINSLGDTPTANQTQVINRYLLCDLLSIKDSTCPL